VRPITVMSDGHGPAMPQVTPVDDQFGTHTQKMRTQSIGSRSPSPNSPSSSDCGSTWPSRARAPLRNSAVDANLPRGLAPSVAGQLP